MRQIDLSNYSVRVRDEKGEWFDLPYEVKDSIIEMLFARDLQLKARELLDRDDLARKIRDCADGQIILEEEEYNKILAAANTVKGLGRPDVELIRRILEAKRIQVEEKQVKGGKDAKVYG